MKQDSTDDGQLQGVVIGVRVQHTETRTEAGVDGDGDGAVSLTVTAENAEPTTNMDRLKWCCNLWKGRGKNGGEADGFELIKMMLNRRSIAWREIVYGELKEMKMQAG